MAADPGAIAHEPGAGDGAEHPGSGTVAPELGFFGAVWPVGAGSLRIGAIGVRRNVGEVNEELAAAGRAPVSAVGFGPVVGFQLQMARFTLGVDAMGFGDWSTAAAIDQPRLNNSAFFATAGYQVVRVDAFSFGPAVGIGYGQSILCVAGPSSLRASPGDTAFRQVLLDAGQQSCLSSSGAVLRLGIAADLTTWTAPDPSGDEPRLGFAVGLRAGYMRPVGGDSRWELDLGDSKLERLRGPAAPIGGFYAGIEVGLAFGVGRDE
jgi:hypothetical protein